MKTKNVLKKFLGGGLALVMALGIFAGTGMDVRAAEDDYKIVKYSLPSTFKKVFQDCVTLEENECDTVKSFLEDHFEESEDWAVLFRLKEYPDRIYSFATEEGDVDRQWFDKFDALQFLQDSGELYILKKNTGSDSGSGSASTDSNAPSTPHTHSYSWVTVQEANAGQDGIEEYRCSCGDVQGRSVIPASAAIVDEFCNAVKNAPVDGIAEYDSGWWHTMSDYLIRELAKRPDVTTVITFEYERQMYKMTIPAGVDYTALLADEDYFYGYFYFANAVGATIETIKTTQ